MMSNARCWRPRRVVLAIAMSLLSGCAMVGSELAGLGVCPPVVEYSEEFQAKAAEELSQSPEGSAIGEMLGGYAVMRDQARACRLP